MSSNTRWTRPWPAPTSATCSTAPICGAPGEGSGFWQVYEDTVNDDVIRGNLVTDAHIAALMRQHGVATIWTADRDFRRFTDVTARDPYAEANG